ncbi:carotenoid oxygenase [Sporosarcina sp. PTS2304]|uniref:carotenoid oxygenase family protein n=1 Tax=Sporosarcina sp. PTS2304 TaxID=2283194 RepID=UPI000E0DD421|nr:carotenoid oxygenase family protein [Sporosarcina sp. PTS2304]AXH99534.1 carotenoid oxygenase [Sporosarcina sp. PTS2304]
MIKVHNEVKITVPEETDNPFLKDLFKPNSKEYTADTDSLTVLGEIPSDLHGIYVRNTHNQVHAPIGTYHPFDGDGMLHAIHFENGKATYRNRFVRTPGFLAEQAAGKSLWPGILEPHLATYRGWGAIGAMKDNAGTDVLGHAGKLIASMSQGSEPHRLDPITLEPLGTDSWGRELQPHGIASHYKVDLKTGEMMFFNYGHSYPYMNYGIIDKNNQLAHYVPIELPGTRWPHDMGITEHYSILHDLPFFFDDELLKKGIRKNEFHPEVPARFGVIPRHGDNSKIRWFEATSCHILHVANCFEDGDEVVMDACVSFNPKKPAVGVQGGDRFQKIIDHLDKHNTQTHMYRWRFNLKTGKTKEEEIDDEVTEFPVVSNDYQGYKYRYSYNTLFKKGEWSFIGIKKYDLLMGTATKYEYGEHRYGDEPQIALNRDASAEDDGYIITLVTDTQEDRSECLILRADDIEAGPVARIILPERIQTGTHACWVEGDRIHNERV